MTQARLNHVSIHTDDIETSAEFYEDLFGMTRVPSPNFEVEVYWLECGDLQIHLFERDVPAPEYHHLGLHVDDFNAVYYRAKEMDIFDDWAMDSNVPGIYGLPDGSVQMYLRDPADNLVEVDWPDVTSLDEEIQEVLVDRDEQIPQTGEAAEATLFLDRPFWYEP